MGCVGPRLCAGRLEKLLQNVEAQVQVASKRGELVGKRGGRGRDYFLPSFLFGATWGDAIHHFKAQLQVASKRVE